MDASHAERLRMSVTQLAADLRDLVRRTESILRLLVDITGDSSHGRRVRQGSGLIDNATFTVQWNGKVCHLGYTVPYRLFVRLSEQPNEFVSHQQLLDDVWGGPRSGSAVRSAVAELRSRLSRAGMKDLAAAIDGTNTGFYGLRLRAPQPARPSD